MGDLMQNVRGILVGASESKYEGFTDREGNERPGGVTRKVYVSPAFGSGPVEISVPGPHALTFEELGALGFGAQVDLLCKIGAYGGNVTVKLVQVVTASRPGQAAASNGKAGAPVRA